MTQTDYDISVIICTYTEERWDDLTAAIGSVQQQTLPPREIIIVIDYNPGLLERVREHLPGVIAIENRRAKGLSGARNSGGAVARGIVVAFLDDDAIAEPQWLEHLVACYAIPHIIGVSGKIEPLWLGPCPSWFPDEFNWVVGCTYRGMPVENNSVRNMVGANMSVRREVLMAEGFRESFGSNQNTNSKSVTPVGFKWLQHHSNEDTEFCIHVTQQRSDGIWFYTPSAIIRHRIPAKRARLAYFLWRCYDEGIGKAMLVRLHGTQVGLSSERSYTFKILPQGVMRGLADALLHHNLVGLARAGAIVIGLAATTIGYLVGTFFRLLVLYASKLIMRPERETKEYRGPCLEQRAHPQISSIRGGTLIESKDSSANNFHIGRKPVRSRQKIKVTR